MRRQQTAEGGARRAPGRLLQVVARAIHGAVPGELALVAAGQLRRAEVGDARLGGVDQRQAVQDSLPRQVVAAEQAAAQTGERRGGRRSELDETERAERVLTTLT